MPIKKTMNYSDELLDLLKIIKNQKRHPKQMNQLNEADCEVLKLSDKNYLAINVDGLGEEILVGLYKDPYTIGRMAVISSLSDLATVGGDPLGVLVAVSWGKDWSEKQKQDFYCGIDDTLKKYKIHLLGGDSGHHLHTTVSVTSLATTKHKPTNRKGAKPGDAVCLLGKVGDGPALAFRYLLDLADDEFSEIKYHPTLFFNEAKILNQNASSIIDTSDGLVTALNHLSLINHVSFDLVWEPKVISEEALKFCQKYKIPPFLLWIGEHGDYQLLLTMPEKNFTKLKKKIKNLEKIGTVTKNKTTFTKDNKILELDLSQLVAELYRRRHDPKSLLKDLIKCFGAAHE